MIDKKVAELIEIGVKGYGAGGMLNKEAYMDIANKVIDYLAEGTTIRLKPLDVSKLREIIKYQVEGRGGRINPKDDFIGFIEDIKSCLTLPKEELDKEKVEKILESHITHVLLYHDKECGRTTEEQIIFKARFGELTQALCQAYSEGRLKKE